MLYVQYGCGYSAPNGWTNFDSSPTLRFERLPVVGRLYTKNAQRFPRGVNYGDVVRGLPISSESCDGVYASHVLEHLSLSDCRAALRETFRILRPGGIFRLVVPDLQVLAEQYVDRVRHGDALASESFMDRSLLGQRSRPRSMSDVASSYLGNSRHLWMWDAPSMTSALENTSFVAVRVARIGDSGDPMFDLVEEPARFEDSFAVQAQRPH
jgi:SAM-dependent methyltransferase